MKNVINVEEHLGLVGNIATKVYKRYCGYHEYDDLMQEGHIGLIQAAKKFDDSKGYKFSTYAYSQIHGHIRNYIRNKRFGPKVGEFDEIYRQLSLNEYEDEHLELEYIDVVTIENVDIFDQVYLKLAIESLEPKYKTLIMMKYFQGYTLHDVAIKLGVSNTTICKYHKRALDKLRMKLGGDVICQK